MNLFVHFESAGGAEPYLTYLECELGPLVVKGGLVRHDVSLPAPRGFTERQVATMGLDIKFVVPWLSQASRLTRTVILYDKGLFLRTLDAEAFRLGMKPFVRQSIEYVELKDKATPLCRLEDGKGGFRAPSLDEASMILLNENTKGIETIKGLYAHKEIKQLAEVI